MYSVEVEQAIASHPDVAMCAVVGTPDVKFGEVVTAVVVLKPQVQAAAADAFQQSLVQHCKERIANYKVPRRVVVWKELPMSGAGKILKTKIREKLGTDALGGAYGSANTAKL